MKKIMILLIIALVLILPLLLAAEISPGENSIETVPPSGASPVAQTLLLLLAPLLASILAPLAVRLFKKLGIELQDQILEPIILQIMQIIAGVEHRYKSTKSGEERRLEVRNKLENTRVLKPVKRKLLEARYGDLDTAIEAAFQRSPYAGKK